MDHTVCIFSRSNKVDYKWLLKLLTSGDLSDRVAGVRCSLICNHGFRQFIEDVSQCTFGILYHTKNRGIINITDIDGALYGDELKFMHDVLGKENVVVVVDDLEDGSDQEKSGILKTQPSIGTQAGKLVLISKTDKADPRILSMKVRGLIPRPAAAAGEEEGSSGTETRICHNTSTAEIWKENVKTQNIDTKPETPSTIHNEVPQYGDAPEIWSSSEETEHVYWTLDELNMSDTQEEFDVRNDMDTSQIQSAVIQNIYVSSPTCRDTTDKLGVCKDGEMEVIEETSDPCFDILEKGNRGDLKKSFNSSKTWIGNENSSPANIYEGSETFETETLQIPNTQEAYDTLDGSPQLYDEALEGTKKKKTKNIQPKKWVFNENDGTWCQVSPEESSAEDYHVIQCRNERPKAQSRGQPTCEIPKSRPANENQKKWRYIEKDEMWYRNENYEETSNNENPETQRENPSTSNIRPNTEKPTKWCYDKKTHRWSKA